jgi:hypothetical protein
MLGLLIAKAFHDPFCLHDSKGWIEVASGEQIGYYGIGALLCEFTKWFGEQAREKRIEKILFPARDGYLIQKLYKLLYGENAVESVYVKASRRAVTVACMENRKDIRDISKRTYQGDCEGFLMSRYGIEMSAEDSRKKDFVKNMSESELEALLRDYEEQILSNALTERERYLRYFDKMGVTGDQRLLLFDFVAGGTVQHSFQRLLKSRSLSGAYFATMNLPNDMYGIDTAEIVSAYGNIQSYKVDSELGKHYLFMETVLVDDQNTFSHFGEDLQEIYEDGVRRSDIGEIQKLQEAAMQYAKDYHTLYGDLCPDLKTADEIYGMLFSTGCRLSDDLKKVFVNDDVYDGVATYGVCD